LGDDDDLARCHFPPELRVDDIQRTRFTGYHNRAVVHLPEDERPQAVRIAGGHDPVGKQQQQRIRALQVGQCMNDVVHLLQVTRFGQQMDDHFRVAGCIEDGTSLLVPVAQQGGVDQVAVVSHGHLSQRILDQ